MLACARPVFVAAAAVAAMTLAAPAARAGQPSGAAPGQAQETAVDPEAELERGAPVLIGGEPVIWITAGVGQYTPQFRADRIGERAREIVHDRSISIPPSR